MLKPSPETVLDAILWVRLRCRQGCRRASSTSCRWSRDRFTPCSHTGVDKVPSPVPATGRQIGAVCGELLRPVTLELGGKSAAIILDDADLDLQRIARRLATALFANNGQTCFLRVAFSPRTVATTRSSTSSPLSPNPSRWEIRSTRPPRWAR